ncbi:MAG: hypothetical protein P1U82_28670, partial [Verrucomicrobiales bacterium]|nr:hypothetical protein [Verrucomicrobiales bacterium]
RMDSSPPQKTTPMLQVWQQDANELGLPENVQKGVIFLIALGMRVDPAFETPEAFLRPLLRLKGFVFTL